MARPRGHPLNHHLTLERGVWMFRWTRGGKDVTRPTGCPKSEVATARKIRDKWIGELSAQRAGIDEIPSAKSLDVVIKLYLEAESRPYDRERGGVQPGAKRSSAGDKSVVRQLRKYLDFALSADRVDKERLFDAAAGMVAAGRVVSTKKGPKRVRDLASFTTRNRFRFLRRVFAWARLNKRKTGVVVNPFDDLGPVERRRLFPGGVARKAPPFSNEQLRALYEVLPAYAYRPVRFAAHTGMRQGELLSMRWGRVDFKRCVYATNPNWTKNGKEREVPLADVALGILKQIRPANPALEDSVWLNSKDEPLRDLDSALKRAVRKKALKNVFPEPRPGWRLPDRHSLRRTCASAVAQVAPMGVVAAVLGHAPTNVTDLYVSIPIEDQIAALNRAARIIDGEPIENVVPLAPPARKTGLKTGVGA